MESMAALETMAKTAAAETLPLELERLGAEGQRELAVRYETSPDKLVGVLTDRHLDGLLNPLGTATPKLQATTPASEGRIIADLYWRCCVAMQMSAPCASTVAARLPACPPACLPADCVYALCVYALCVFACVYACGHACVNLLQTVCTTVRPVCAPVRPVCTPVCVRPAA